ncbi:MAG TPA: zinc ribbon domain-containing protein [Chthoniobacterales bacterium]|jgi:hypothetical protein|nr:zinc ribbon domain-containing protein [Chthoniobacterales bacterium]
MTTTTTATEKGPKLICPECRRENETARIFCHECGQRLDRSAITAQKKPQTAEDERKRLQRMMEGPSKLRQNFFTVSKLALAAAVAAALVEIALPPDVPAPTKTPAPQMDLELENAATFHKAGPFEFSQDQVNAYLVYRLTSKKKILNQPLLDFVRATAVFRDGTCTIGMERSLFGYSLFTQSSYRVESAGGKMTATNVGGWLGRLPVHPAIMKYGDIIFADLRFALDREHKLMAKMAGVNFHDGGVTITPPTR